MSRAQFEKQVTKNSREASKLVKGKGGAGGDKEFGAILAQYTADQVAIAFPPFLYDKANYPESAEFDEKLLKSYYDKYKNEKASGKHGFRSATLIQDVYVFYWTARPGSGIDGKKFVEGSRRFIGDLFQQQGVKRPEFSKAGDDFLVGGHVESSALLGKLRKGVAFGLITVEEAQAYLAKYGTGGVDKLEGGIGGLGSKVQGPARDTVSKGDAANQGFLETEYSREAFKIDNSLIKEISEHKNNHGLYHEVMIPIPKGLNSAQEHQFEIDAQNNVEAWLLNIADEKLVDDPTSPSAVEMYQNIIAAKLLGKNAPKYKINHKITKKAQNKKQNRKVRLEGSKRSATKAASARFKAQLRNAKGQFASPTALQNLLNTKLQKELIDNMGYPALENITGKFANSVRVLKVTQKGTLPSIQYTYDQDPYSVFEMGGRGNRKWATTDRDPRVLIDRTVREIAQEMMINKFTTQRL